MYQRIRSIMIDTAWLSMGYASYHKLPVGISLAGEPRQAEVQFFYDVTYVDNNGSRHVEQSVFDELIRIIKNARRLIVIDMFLFNDFQGLYQENTRDLCGEVTELLVTQKSTYPELKVYFITDPINTVYGGLTNIYLDRLQDANVEVVFTDLDQLRDSNPLYSFFWRLFVRPFGNSHAGWLPSPFSGDRVTVRSYLKLFNLKANHRKSVIADDGLGDWLGFVGTGNPHNGSSAHRNVAIRFNGNAVRDLYKTECAVLNMCRVPVPVVELAPKAVALKEDQAAPQLQIVTEKKIKEAVLATINASGPSDEIDLVLFYLSERQVIKALKKASARGVVIRLILDPNKDAFGLPKIGIPNRPVAYNLRKAGVETRWADTHGEQCHSKLMLAHQRGKPSTLILGSANFTRRNLDDFNLETSVVIKASRDSRVIKSVSTLFQKLWSNEENRYYTADYEKYHDTGRLRYLLYLLMEVTGISTF